jgi:uncharacterized membrane protein YkvA (DUF1232 family)
MIERGNVSDGMLSRARARFYASLAFLAAGVLYALFPLDLIPDLLGPLGWVDDIGVLFVAFTFALRSYRRVQRARGGLNDRSPRSTRSSGR